MTDLLPALHNLVFYGAAFVAIATTCLVLGTNNAVYAVLYLVMSLFSVSLVFWSLGAPFLAVLEVLVYAGAIMVLFLFVVMMLNLGSKPADDDLRRPSRKVLLLPVLFGGVLAIMTLLAIVSGVPSPSGAFLPLSAKELGQVLFTRHYLGVELVSLILTIGMVGGMHLGRAASLTAEEQSREDAHAVDEKRSITSVKEAA